MMRTYFDERLNDYIIDSGIDVVTVTEVKPTPDYKLLLTFSTGEKKVYDMKPEIESDPADPLRNIALFMKAHTDGVSVAWTDEIDIAPEELYENSTPK
jgi:hypothetical protein